MLASRADNAVARYVSDYNAGRVEHEMLRRLCQWYRWLTLGQCSIRSANAAIIPLIPNATQRIIILAMMQQAALGRPVRLIVLKARKRGVTTLVQSLFFFLSAHFENQVGYLLSHQADSTAEIYGIAKLMAQRYRLIGPETRERTVLFPDTDSRLKYHTAGGENIGAGGTPSMLHLSERALWSGNNSAETETASTQAVPYLAGTVIVYESTARGRETFFRRYESALLEPNDPYVACFIPWFMDSDETRIDVPADYDEKLDDDEIAVVRLARDQYGIELTGEHIAWRRMKLLELGDNLFRQEYPSTAVEAASSFSDLVLPHMENCVIGLLPFELCAVEPEQLIGGIDFGFHDPCAIVTGVWRDQTLFIIDVWRRAHSLAADQVEGLHDGTRYSCDPGATQAREELASEARNVGLEVYLRPAPRQKAERQVNFIHYEWGLIQGMVRQNRLKILRGCERQLLTEAAALCYSERTAMPDNRRTDETGHYDCLDALRYLCMGVVRRPFVPMPMVDPSDRPLSRRAMFLGFDDRSYRRLKLDFFGDPRRRRSGGSHVTYHGN